MKTSNPASTLPMVPSIFILCQFHCIYKTV
jgi:hypothetical protein